MSVKVGLEAQPKFPYEDLTPSNARMLEIMMSNLDVVYETQAAAEIICDIYDIGHRAVLQAGGRVAVLEPKIEIFNHGICIYEAMSVLLRNKFNHMDRVKAINQAACLTAKDSATELYDYANDSYEKFAAEMPRTCATVEESTARFFPNDTGYAVIGAALLRQFELDNT